MTDTYALIIAERTSREDERGARSIRPEPTVVIPRATDPV